MEFHSIGSLVFALLFSFSLSMCDLIFTISNLKRYKKLNPNKDEKDLEINPLPRFIWKTFGYKFGTVLQTLYNGFFIGLFLFVPYIYEPEIFFFAFGFLSGSLLIVNLIHYGNLKTIKEIELELKSNGGINANKSRC